MTRAQFDYLMDASLGVGEVIENQKRYINSLEEQNQGLQSLLDLKQQEISVLESKVGDVKTCDGCEIKHNINLRYSFCNQCVRRNDLRDNFKPKQN